jgi:uncharacterized protein (DUF362 family)
MILEVKENLEKAIETAFLKATNNLKWLKKGDKVFLKFALNSPDPYPATTHPLALKVVKRVIERKGGDVLVGDQSGVASVANNPKGVVFGDTYENFKKATGMKMKGFIAFEKTGWDKGFYHFPPTPNWKNGFWLTNVVKEADHIINLPRLSTHLQAGVTLGFKNFVGLLREDSRMEFHASGPFYNGLKVFAKGVKTDFKNEHKFIEKITEISLALKDKLRCTLFVATEAQVSMGPNAKSLIFKSKKIQLDPGLIIASSNQIEAEKTAFNVLKKLRKQHLNWWDKLLENTLLKQSKRWRNNNQFVEHAKKIGL